ncbi:MAG: hypothetical protein ACOC83_10400 [Gemmatimonadota bacterium]
MGFFDKVMRGLQDAIKPQNIVMVLAILFVVGFYISSDLPGARPLRENLPLG